MKTINLIAAAIALTTLSFGTLAAEQISAEQASSLDKIGVVSVTGAGDLSTLETQLSSKADAIGAKYIRIIAASSSDKLRGTAIAYK